MMIRPSFHSDLIGDNRERRLSALSSLDQLLRDHISAISQLQREIGFAQKLLSERCGVPDADAIETYLSREALERLEAQQQCAGARTVKGAKAKSPVPVQAETEPVSEGAKTRAHSTGRERSVMTAAQRRASVLALIAGE